MGEIHVSHMTVVSYSYVCQDATLNGIKVAEEKDGDQFPTLTKYFYYH